jgi:hypothetical protein
LAASERRVAVTTISVRPPLSVVAGATDAGVAGATGADAASCAQAEGLSAKASTPTAADIFRLVPIFERIGVLELLRSLMMHTLTIA